MNNYEISEWELWYLRLWNLEPDCAYITTAKLFVSLQLPPIPFFNQYFSYASIINNFILLDQKVTIDDFIQFVLLFGFFDVHTLLPCFFEITGIHSHKYITTVLILFNII